MNSKPTGAARAIRSVRALLDMIVRLDRGSEIVPESRILILERGSEIVPNNAIVRLEWESVKLGWESDIVPEKVERTLH